MADELKFPGADGVRDDDSIGEPLVSLIREAYTPPDAAAWPDVYWSGLERRIMSRVSAEAEKSWWAELLPWGRIVLAAAGAIFAVAGVINYELADPEDQIAYEAFAQPDLTAASDEPIASQYLNNDSDGVTLRYFISN